MIEESAIAGLSADDQAYVMGHAIGVYLMGKTLPGRVADHGYLYRPGKSSPSSNVEYYWEQVMRARSGGSDGYGGVIYDDVGQPTPEAGDDGFRDPGANTPTEPGTPSDDVDSNPDDPNEPGGNDPPGGDDPPDHGGECGIIERQCSKFLNPSAFDARGMADDVDPARFATVDVTGPALDRFTQLFEAGMAEALSVENIDELIDNSEVVYVGDDVLDYGLCEE